MRLSKPIMSLAMLIGMIAFGHAQNELSVKNNSDDPIELEVIKSSIGAWDAAIEVWPEGRDKPSLKFKGVETNQAHGKHWMSSDFVSTYQGQKMVVHSIVGYDLDKKSLFGMIVDYGPYKATMTGTYDAKEKKVTWETHGKLLNGDKLFQLTTITQKSKDERLLVLSNPGKKKGEYVEFMTIRYTRKKESVEE